MVGISCIGNIPTVFLKSLEESRREWRSKRYLYDIEWNSDPFLDVSRCNIVRHALYNHADYLFFLDSDIILPPNALENLLQDDKDIVSGIYYYKNHQHVPIIMKKVSKFGFNPYINYLEMDNDKDIIEIDAMGLGCCMIKTDIFKRLPYPWFNNEWIENEETAKTKILEGDFYFCNLLKESGYKIYADKRVQCGHYGTIVTPQMFLNNKDKLVKKYNLLNQKIEELSKSTNIPITELWDKIEVTNENGKMKIILPTNISIESRNIQHNSTIADILPVEHD